MCIEDAEIAFTEGDLTLVLGENNDRSSPVSCSNGAGKSAIFEALYWCLYERTTRRNFRSTQVQRMPGREDTQVVVEYALGDDQAHTVDRQRAGGKSSVRCSSRHSFEAHTGLTPELFLSSVMFAQVLERPFSRYTPKQRYEVLRGFSQAALEADELLGRLRLYESSLSVFVSKVNARLAEAQRLGDRFASSLTVQERKALALQARHLQRRLGRLGAIHAAWVTRHTELKRLVDTFDGVARCPLCGQEISQERIEGLALRLSEVSASKTWAKIREVVARLQAEETAVRRRLREAHGYLELTEDIQTRLGDLQQERESLTDDMDIAELAEKVLERARILAVGHDVCGALNDALAGYSEALCEGAGAISLVTRGDAVHINSSLGPHYSAQSPGELQRIDLAVQFALFNYLRTTSIGTNLAIFDEVFRSLDASGARAVMLLLEELADRGVAVFVVTHRSDLQFQIGNVIIARKENGKTVLAHDDVQINGGLLEAD
jgi:hypothetical protein